MHQAGNLDKLVDSLRGCVEVLDQLRGIGEKLPSLEPAANNSDSYDQKIQQVQPVDLAAPALQFPKVVDRAANKPTDDKNSDNPVIDEDVETPPDNREFDQWANAVGDQISNLSNAINWLIENRSNSADTEISQLHDTVNGVINALGELRDLSSPDVPVSDSGIADALARLDKATKCIRPGAITGSGITVSHLGDKISLSVNPTGQGDMGSQIIPEDGGNVFPVTLTQTGGTQGTATTAASWTYTVTNSMTLEQLATAVSPVASPHLFKRPSVGFMTTATAGLAYINNSDQLVLAWINEIADQEACS